MICGTPAYYAAFCSGSATDDSGSLCWIGHRHRINALFQGPPGSLYLDAFALPSAGSWPNVPAIVSTSPLELPATPACVDDATYKPLFAAPVQCRPACIRAPTERLTDVATDGRLPSTFRLSIASAAAAAFILSSLGELPLKEPRELSRGSRDWHSNSHNSFARPFPSPLLSLPWQWHVSCR